MTARARSRPGRAMTPPSVQPSARLDDHPFAPVLAGALDRVHIHKVAKRYGSESALAGVSL
jgi:hypothetical protein